MAEVLLDIGSSVVETVAPEPVPPGKPPKLIFKSQTVVTKRPFKSLYK